MGIYERVSIKKIEYTSKNSKQVSTVDFFVKMHDGVVGAVSFYFVSDFNVNVYIELYDLIEKNDQFHIVQPSQLSGVFSIKNIANKLIYMKIGARDVVTERPNSYEKS